jgi:RND family efflux transporter MFP subunit
MKIKQSLLITLMLASMLAQGCTRTAKTAEKAPTPVKVEAVQSYTAQGGARYSASIVPGSQVELSFSVGGYLDHILQMKGADGRLRNVQQGDAVGRGQVLARLRVNDYAAKVDQASGQLAQMRASLTTSSKQLAEAEVGAEKARLDFERAESLFATQSMTKPEYDAAKSQYDLYRAKIETARSQLAVVRAQISAAEAAQSAAAITRDDTVLKAPLTGLLLQRSVEVGQLISPGKPAFVVADTSYVKAQFGVPDLDVHNLALGGLLAVTLDALPGKAFTGRVTSISPSADQKTRLFEVEVTIANPGGQLKIGMIASLQLAAATQTVALPVVPLNAIIRSKDRPDEYALFVIEDQSGKPRGRLRSVTLGDAYGNRIAVTSGVQIGDRVVTSGGGRLVDGEFVQVIP